MTNQKNEPVADEPSRRITAPRQGLTARSVLAGVVCVALVCILVTWAELVISTIRIGYLQLPPVSIGMLMLVLALSHGLRQILGRRWAFTGPEIATVYIMCLVAAMVSSHGLVQRWIPLMVVPLYFANPGNRWMELFDSHIARWMVPFDPHGAAKQDVATWFYEKMPAGASIPWHAWVTPLLVWGFLLAMVVFAFMCLTAILQRQWADNEKLAFPLAQLPIEMIGGTEGKGFFGHPLVWLGVAVPVAVYGVDWLHQIMPSVPLIATSLSLNDYLVNSRWASIGYTPLIYSFAAIGFFYLLPSDILFSIWFFFLFSRLEQMLAIMGNMDMPGMPMYPPPLFEGYQTAGAYLVLALYFFKNARPHLRKVWAAAIGREKQQDESILSYPVAFWGLVGSLLIACGVLCAMGMSFWVAAMELFVFVFIIALVMARTTAEAGMLMTETTFRPIDLYRVFGDIHSLGSKNITGLAFVDNLLLRDQRGLLLTGMLDSAKLGDASRLRRRSLATALAIGLLVAVAVAVPLQLALPYWRGGATMDGWMMQGSPTMSFNDYQVYLQHGAPLSSSAWQMPVFLGVGIGVTLFLSAMRSMFYWWPLHPLGYAIAGSWSSVQFWFPCLVAWVLKGLSLRYGGMPLYARLRPFFLGLIIGEFGMAVLSTVVNVLCNVPPPPFPWQ